MKQQQRIIVWPLLCLVLLGVPCGAASDASLDEAMTAWLAREYQALGDSVQVDVIPARSATDDCQAPQFSVPRSTLTASGRVTVALQCDPGGRVVAYRQARITVFGTYLALARDVSAGEQIDRNMLIQATGDITPLLGSPTLTAEQAEGSIARRALASGVALTAAHLRRPELVARGAPVDVEVSGPGFRVRRTAQALDSGGLGDTIRVQFSRREVLNARVAGTGRVVVGS